MTTTSDDQIDAPPQTLGRPHGVAALLRRLHFYAGIFVGPFILIAAVTGLLYAVIPQIDNVVYRHELTVDQVGAQRLSLAQQLDAVRAAHPEGTVESIRPPAEPDETTRVTLAVDDVPPDYARTVFVDPYSGEVRGALTTYGQWMPLRAWFDELHRTLHLGTIGRNYSELAASWLWVTALAGLVLWIGHRRQTGKLTRIAVADRSVKGRRRTLSWHGAVGVWIVVALLGLSVTGITWSRYGGESVNVLQEHLNTTAPEVSTALAAKPASGIGHVHGHGADIGDTLLRGAERALDTAHAAGLSGPIWLYPPAESGEGWLVKENKRDWPTQFDAIAVNPETGTITDRVDFADWPLLAKLTRWAIDTHMGILFGIPNQIALALTAIGLILVILRGYQMWWQRRPTRGKSWTMGRPPLRGTIRHMSPVAAVGIGVLAIGLGWFLPLFGVSLLAFLLVDAAVGTAKRWHTRR
ncbi:PepSY domain-containing protein [Mycobacterium sp. 1274761.0]|uniref:PepSY-associated TM helix domain-containing protein n=1 Tax=Mycobacterium sp. 1274761.0 TaxID=1834077 RepID=UPI00080009C7|nr:PepSY domain-containing protein [Mycobacterium sp. 1274761.0]OBK71991.1 peptidase [Mycobacterium sp. 1274761.0]